MKAIGINVDIQQLQVGAVVQKVMAGQTPINAGSWGSYSINDVSAIMPYFFGGGSNDYSRDPKVMELVKAGVARSPTRRSGRKTIPKRSRSRRSRRTGCRCLPS